MKYVLVIDVPEPMESKDVKIDYLCYYHCGNIIENKIDVFPKPLPEKKNTSKLQYFGKSTILWSDREIYQNEGWNACLEELEK